MRDGANAIVLDGAAAAYRGRRVFGPASLAFAAGSFTAVIGPNGAGKSTLLKLMTGELAPAAGTVSLDGRDLARLPPPVLARRRAVLPQTSNLVFPFTVAEVVGLGLEAGGRSRDRQAVGAALERVDLVGFAGRFYGELSGGEQQRVHLARVLCQIGAPIANGEARFLLLDEPVSSLDIRHQLGVLAIAQDFARAGGGVVAILHDLNLASAFADRIVALAGGGIAAEGAPAAVLTDALIAEIFDVRLRVGAVPPPGAPFVLPHGSAERKFSTIDSTAG